MLIKGGNLFCDDGVFRAVNLTSNGGFITDIGETAVCPGEEAINAAGCYRSRVGQG